MYRTVILICVRETILITCKLFNFSFTPPLYNFIQNQYLHFNLFLI